MIRTPALLLAALLLPGTALAHHDEPHPAANLMAQNGRVQSDAMPEQRRQRANPDVPAGTDDAASQLRAAQVALRAGRAGQANDLLERAESRLLTRGTLPVNAGKPVLDGPVGRIAAARAALAANDRVTAENEIKAALATLGPRPARAPR